MKKNKQTQFSQLIDKDHSKGTVPDDVFPDKVSLEKLRVIWNDDDVQYSDEQLYKIREWLYALTTVIIHVVEKQAKNSKVIELKPKEDEQEESDTLRSSEYRRAS